MKDVDRVSDVKDITSFMREAGVLDDIDFQKAMVSVARIIYFHSAAYHNLQNHDEPRQRKREENDRNVRIILKNDYVQVDQKDPNAGQAAEIVREGRSVVFYADEQ